jgi:hypothetical protein
MVTPDVAGTSNFQVTSYNKVGSDYFVMETGTVKASITPGAINASVSLIDPTVGLYTDIDIKITTQHSITCYVILTMPKWNIFDPTDSMVTNVKCSSVTPCTCSLKIG